MFQDDYSTSADSLQMSSASQSEFVTALNNLQKTNDLKTLRDGILEELEMLEFEYYEKLSQNAVEEEIESVESRLAEIDESMQQNRDKLIGVSNFLATSIQKSINSLQNAKKSQSEMEIIEKQIDKLNQVLDSIQPEHLVKNDENDASAMFRRFEDSIRRNSLPSSPAAIVNKAPMITSTPNIRPRTLKRPETFIANSKSVFRSNVTDSQGQNQIGGNIEMRQRQARERAVEMQNNEISNRITRHTLHEKLSRTEGGGESPIEISDISIVDENSDKQVTATKDGVYYDMIYFYSNFLDNFCKGEMMLILLIQRCNY